MWQRHKKIIITIACILSVIIIGCGVYVSDYYPANEQALEALVSDEEVTVSELDDGSYLFEPDEAIAGLIFYPGGKVEHTAYAPLMREYAKQGIQCVLIKMPFRLAVLDINAADGMKEQYPEIEKWYIGGHSLGGSMAASYAAGHVEEFEGLFLLASYSTEDLSDSKMKIISIYGSKDEVLNMEKYQENRDNLPTDTKEEMIVGGCHAYFGSYGEQDGDGIPDITPENQQRITVETTMKNLEADNGL